MLRITEITDGHPGVLLKLEGKLRGPWVEELGRVCAELSRRESRAVRLDLSAVTFLDEAGTRLLRELLRGGAAVTASGFVAESLRREDR
jgi:anti-anti-sigma regulatory factor